MRVASWSVWIVFHASVVMIGALWMLWLKENVDSAMIQGCLFVLYFYFALGSY